MKNDLTFLEPLDRAILELIQSVPARWKTYKTDELTATQEEGVKLLIAAGFIEQRHSIRLRKIGSSKIVFATFRVTGVYGLVEVNDKITEAVKEWQNEGFKNQLLCERDSSFQMRLTDQGELAQKDLVDGEHSRVLDFVKKTGYFAVWPPVRGHGIVESLEVKDSTVTPPTVSAQASIGDIQVNTHTHIQVNTEAIGQSISSALDKLGQVLKPTESQSLAQSPSPTTTSETYSDAKRSWMADELNEAIREYRAQHASIIQEFLSVLDNPKETEIRKKLVRKDAQKLFGRNVIAKALGVKAARMVSDSSAWKALAASLGLSRKRDDFTLKSRLQEESPDDLTPRSAQKPYAADDTTPPAEILLMQKEREQTLHCIRQLASSPRKEVQEQVKALFKAYEEGEMTDEQVRQTIVMLHQKK